MSTEHRTHKTQLMGCEVCGSSAEPGWWPCSDCAEKARAGPERLVKVQVLYEGHDRNDIFKMKSPTGKIKTIFCRGVCRTFSDELSTLICSLMKSHPDKYRWGTWKPVIVPIRLMEEVKDLDQKGRAKYFARKGH